MSLLKDAIRFLFQEAPIRDFDVIGKPMDQAGGGFLPQDRKLLSNPKAIEKIRKQWDKTSYIFDMYLLKIPKLNNEYFREVGLVYPGDRFSNAFEEAAGQPMPNSPGAITILFNGNYGADKVPMTGWIMAHRFGHAVRRLPAWDEYIEEMVDITKRILDEVYNKTLHSLSKDAMFRYSWNGQRNSREDVERKILTTFFNQFGTFKSAREGKISRYYEFFYEVFAQYLITGSVRFNPLTKSIVVGTLPFGRKEMAHAVDEDLVDMWNRDLSIYADMIESRIINVLEDAQGKTFLM